MALRLGSKANATLHSRAGDAEPQFLHVRVAGSLQRVDAGPSQLRAELLEKSGQRQNLGVNAFL